MTDRLLELLRASDAPLPPEEMARRLGVAYDQVRVHIDALRRGGIRIDFAPEEGFSLGRTPDLLFDKVVQKHLKTRIIGNRVIFRHEVNSTNSLAMALARNDEPHGTVVVADRQTGGRGRMGRSWESPAGVNIYMSVILRPRVHPEIATQIPILSVIAVSRALERFEPTLKYGIKWPNDLYIESKKLSGILCEMRTGRVGVHYLVAGIGVNVNMTGMDDSISETATSLCIETGTTHYRPVLAALMLEEIEFAYDEWIEAGGLLPFMDYWRERSILRGRTVSIGSGQDMVTGIAEGLAVTGALQIRTGRGLEEVFAGDANMSVLKE